MLPLRDTKLSDSLSVSPSRPAERLSASAKLAVGGVLWLVLSLIFSCWVQWHMQNAPHGQPSTQSLPNVTANSAANSAEMGSTSPLATPLGLAVSHAVWLRFDKALTLELVDTLLAQALPKALPLAQWQRVVLPHAGGAGQPGQTGDAAADGYTGAGSALSLEDSSVLHSADTSAALTSPATNRPSPALSALAGADGVRLITVSGPCAPLRLGLALLEGLSAQAETLRAAGARAEVRWTPNGALEILLNHLVYYAVKFPEHQGQLADLAQPLPDAALAIVLDDMGQSPDAADEAAALPFAVTLAIWPRASHAHEVAAVAAGRRLDCLLHQPMEPLPRADHRRPDPGPGALLTTMSAEQIGATLDANLRALPTVIGLNNHMGSAFTGDISLCRTLAGMLGGHGLAVLDSVTRPDPQLALAAREAGLVGLARDVFLDTRRDTAAILVALDAAAARARAKGMAVAIGHPYAETLRALRQWQDREGAAVVPLRRIIWKLAQDNAAFAARTHSRNTNME